MSFFPPSRYVAVNGLGVEIGAATYPLATALASLAAGAGTVPVANIAGGTYIFAAQFTGASLKLQALGPNGTTWLDVLTLNAPQATGVVLGNNATVRLFNPGGAAVTTIDASLT